jgi:hypothetical protein
VLAASRFRGAVPGAVPDDLRGGPAHVLNRGHLPRRAAAVAHTQVGWARSLSGAAVLPVSFFSPVRGWKFGTSLTPLRLVRLAKLRGFGLNTFDTWRERLAHSVLDAALRLEP